MAVAVVAGLGFARAETPDFAHAAVTDMNPGVNISKERIRSLGK